MYSEVVEKESTNSDSDDDDETHLTSFMVDSSKIKKVKKFNFVTKGGKHIHLSEEEVNHQKKIEEDAKAEAAKHESEVRKEELVDLLGLEVVNKYYNDKLQYDRYYDKMLNRRAESRITNFSDLHLDEWREVMNACPNRTGKGWKIIYDQIRSIMDYVHSTKAELGINLDIPLTNKMLKSSVHHEHHLVGTVLNEHVFGMIMFNSYHRQDFFTIEDLRDFSNTMLYTVQEIFFRRHQFPGLNDHARTFSALLLAKIDKRNLNPLKQIRTIKQLRQ
ncbi:hypothetical protein Tco_0600301 [Tanacetum coccineum]|uniref:Uncharacterized protein n=1 Tax=Tanacetum coccineum TaxID=301880 RepID=A0ABQ4WBF1_9ASTR